MRPNKNSLILSLINFAKYISPDSTSILSNLFISGIVTIAHGNFLDRESRYIIVHVQSYESAAATSQVTLLYNRQ